MSRHASDTPVKSSSCIHQWLCEIQSEADIEDGDFDVVSPTEKCEQLICPVVTVEYKVTLWKLCVFVNYILIIIYYLSHFIH